MVSASLVRIQGGEVRLALPPQNELVAPVPGSLEVRRGRAIAFLALFGGVGMTRAGADDLPRRAQAPWALAGSCYAELDDELAGV
eukprot:3408435-Lingulodinium_polyedra.AAC.1